MLADFEGPGYGSWRTTGEAFGTGPAAGSLGDQQEVSGYVGKGLVNTFLRSERTGLARVSARRYLEQLVTQQEADVRQRYGTAGRPERRFTLRRPS